jgi:hypothetical protein
MQRLRDYLTIDGWVKDWEETSAKRIIDYVKLDLTYTAVCSPSAGLGNALRELGNNDSFTDNFWQATYNHIPMGLIGNRIQPFANHYVKKTKHPRLWANLWLLFTGTVYGIGHYISGTENPIDSIIPPTFGALVVVNTLRPFKESKEKIK